MDSYWYQSKLNRFKDRENISYENLYQNFFLDYGISKECVKECLQAFEEVYKVPLGKFRPYDSLEKFFKGVESKHFYATLTYEFYDSEIEDQLIELLEVKLKKHGTFKFWLRFETILDFVLAWCGKFPVTISS